MSNQSKNYYRNNHKDSACQEANLLTRTITNKAYNITDLGTHLFTTPWPLACLAKGILKETLSSTPAYLNHALF